MMVNDDSSVVNKCHLLPTLESSFTIVIYLQYRPQFSTDLFNIGAKYLYTNGWQEAKLI